MGGESSDMKYIVYILYSQKLSKRYIGRTTALKERFKQHNDGRVAFTKQGLPWKLIYYEVFLSKKDAIAEEQFLKTGKGRERLKLLLPDTVNTLRAVSEVVKRA